MRTQEEIVNTEIPCTVCKGTKINHHPHSHECGACFGTGLSTDPWHQKWKATTVTKTPAELKEMVKRGIVIDYQRLHTDSVRMVALIAWPNLDYAANLAQARREMNG